MNASLKIKIFDAKGTHLVPVSKSTVTVGSASHCDVVLNHPSVMPEHIRAWCEGGRIWVQDLSSSAGSAINGIRLPPLKPMLVREIDVLKLGECPATLSMEPNLVRAPLVNKVDLDEVTLTDVKAIVPDDSGPDKNRAEADKISRELADLKLQLQMAKLDRDTIEDLRKETQALKDELQKSTEDKKKLKEAAQHADTDKKSYRRQFDLELNELKLKALREAKEQRDEDQRKFSEWKQDAVARLAAAVHELGEAKEKAWITRPLSKDMMLEWAGDMNDLFRLHLLGEKPQPHTPPLPDVPVRQDSLVGRIAQHTATGIRVLPKPGRSSRRKKRESPAGRYAIIGLVLVVLACSAFLVMKPKRRVVEGARASASESPAHAVEAPPAAEEATPAPAPAPVQALNPPPAQHQQVAKKVFAPPQNKIFKKTYTDNVLFTLNYAEAEMNMDFRSQWIKDLNRVGKRDWKMDSRTLGGIATNELVLIQDLNRMRNAVGPASDSDRVGRMRQREAQFVKELTRQLGKKASLEKFMNLKRAFYNRNQVYLTRETR
jgi:pSer/pThr/pTyr-binding forkhead associated (FHA) protein